MSNLHVCGLSHFKDTLQRSKASHVLSLVNAGMEVPYPLSIPLENRLKLSFNDIEEKLPGFIEPKTSDIEKMVRFIRDWDQKQALVIHCWMGVSRSTAGAFIALCTLFPTIPENKVAQLLRRKSPEATPNKRLVALADDFLGRNGCMIKAIKQIGRGQDCFEGQPFHISFSEIR